MNQSYSQNDPFEQGNQLDMDVQLTQASKAYLSEAARWARFLGIVGFIFIGLFVIMALFMGSMFSSMPGMEGAGALGGGFITAIYLVFAAIYFFPTLYLYRFGTRTKVALANYDTDGLTDGLGNLKSTFKFMGILTIIMLGLYGLLFLIGIFAGATAFM